MSNDDMFYNDFVQHYGKPDLLIEEEISDDQSFLKKTESQLWKEF